MTRVYDTFRDILTLHAYNYYKGAGRMSADALLQRNVRNKNGV